jgi:hypothetical protein
MKIIELHPWLCLLLVVSWVATDFVEFYKGPFVIFEV